MQFYNYFFNLKIVIIIFYIIRFALLSKLDWRLRKLPITFSKHGASIIKKQGDALTLDAPDKIEVDVGHFKDIIQKIDTQKP